MDVKWSGALIVVISLTLVLWPGKLKDGHSLYIPTSIDHDNSAPPQLIRISVAELPVLAESTERGILIEYLHQVEAESGLTFSIEVLPFARSLKQVEDGKADIHLPLINSAFIRQSVINPQRLKLSDLQLFQVAFRLYFLKDKPVPFIGDGKHPIIATDLAHVSFFDFPTLGIPCVSCGLDQIEKGRIEGLIFAETEVNNLIREKQLQQIDSILYERFAVHFVVANTEKGKQLEARVAPYFAQVAKTFKRFPQ